MVVQVTSLKETIPVDAFTSLPRTFLKTIGMPSVSVNNVLKLQANYLYHASFWNLGLCVLGEMIYFLLGFLGVTDVPFLDMTFLILCIGFIMITFAKTFALLFQSERMNNLLTDLQAMYPSTQQEQQEFRVPKYLAEIVLVMRMYAIIQMLMILCFSFFPFAETFMNWYYDSTWEVRFPYMIWYPFNPWTRGVFEFLIASQCWAAYVSAAGILAVDMLLCGIVQQICMQFDDLKRRFMNFKPKRQYFHQDMEVLRIYIAKHSEIMR